MLLLQDVLMLAALFILRIVVPLLLVTGIGYSLARRWGGITLDWSPRFVTLVGLVLALWAIAAITLILRLIGGLGPVTNLSDEFPLGLWIGFDVMAGAMLGGGAFVLAGLVYVISAITVGLAMVVVESNLSSRGLKRGLEQDLLASLARANAFLLAFYVLFKLGDVIARGKASLLTESSLQSLLFWCEVGLGAILPAILMVQPRVRVSRNALFAAAGLVVAGGILNRLNVSVFGLWSYTGPIYLPSWMEVALTLALFTFGAAVFAAATRYLPVFPTEEPEKT